ncbi:DoxX family membrane protein [Urechidicola croceus]|uniref:DoxX family protein n=1 Tax=Urechidicola croceus TaxID=1850246 RepID=A0A1D8P3U2_9FLAO|nr:DoxX family protein [Urechidicola croceus]AOW19186.1 DoxX family protein [Urechidicola croceus]
MNKNISLILRIIIAAILIQTLRYKFTAHPDSVYIFSKVGLEPIGRIGIGVLELISAILILIPRTIWLGSLLTIGIIGGAIMMHLTKLGIEIHDDGGSLFYTALIVFMLSIFVFINYRKNIPIIGHKL